MRAHGWNLVVNPPGILAGPSATTYLTRHFGSFLPSLPSQAELDAALLAADGRSLTATIRLACHLPGAA